MVRLAVYASAVLCLSGSVATALPNDAGKRSEGPVSVNLGGRTYVNKGLVGFGFVASDQKDSQGDTIGGIGSGIRLKPDTWKSMGNGTFTGTLVGQPDRGYNDIKTIDYHARRHEFSVTLTPYNKSDKLDFDKAAETLQLTYDKTIVHTDSAGVPTTGLDALAIQPKDGTTPELPLANSTFRHLSVDTEGLSLAQDGSAWASDEFGPYIYRFDAGGKLAQVIAPPDAFLPHDKDGKVNFTSEDNPETGRQANQGFEGLTLDDSTNTLYALLQSATMQDGGSDKSTSRYTRLLAYDVSTEPAALKGEWVVPLPLDDNKDAVGSSEVQFVGNGVFLTLPRDSIGRGGDDGKSKFKQIDLFDISNATDIHGTKYDDADGAVAPDGKLVDGITPAEYQSFVNMIDDDQLGRFGIHNGKPDDHTQIDAKWESLALAYAYDDQNPDDFFLFAGADNDFQSKDGVADGVHFDAGINEDNEILVWRVTLPGAVKPL